MNKFLWIGIIILVVVLAFIFVNLDRPGTIKIDEEPQYNYNGKL